MKLQNSNSKCQINSNEPSSNTPKRKYDLEKRTYKFAKNVSMFCRELPDNVCNFEHAKQLVRSSGSVGANYIEANESLSKKDFAHRIKICRKESKESAYWLKLIAETNSEEYSQMADILRNEAVELKKIFSSIVNKSK